MLRIHVTRGSTSMGDDADDHPWDLTVVNGTTLGELLDRVFRKEYLPMGWVIDWRVWVGGDRDGRAVAVAILHTLPQQKQPSSIDVADGISLHSRLDSLGPVAESGVLGVWFEFDPPPASPISSSRLG